jgi:muramidase (phage lysozyme)
MVVQILQNMARSIGGVARETGQFRQAAAQQNKSISNFIKDISKIFNSQNKQQSGIASSLDDIQYQSVQTSSKIDSTNALLQESISLQSQMLSELRNVSSGISSLLGSIGGEGGSGLGWKSLLAAGGIGAAAGAIGSQGLDIMSGMGIGGGGDNSSSGGSSGGGSGSSYKPSSPGQSTLASTNLKPEEKAILETISKGESSGKYNIINYKAPGGGGRPQYFEMSDNAQHPFKGKKGYTAAGRYQFLWSTWASEVKSMGEDPNTFAFTPENQDRVAVSHAKRRYKSLTGRDLLEDIKSQDPKILSGISNTLRPTWHGIQGGNYLGTSYEHFKKQSSQQESTPEEKDDGNNQDQIQGQKRKSGTGEIVSKESAMSGGAVTYAYGKGTTRSKPIQPRLMSILQLAAREAGVDVQIFSGGQPAKGSGGKRTGSTRHDNGNAADVRLLKGGKKVTDQETIAKFIAAASKAGATGIGHGPGYMEQGGIHVGFGKPAVWGAGGRGANAPAWVRAAAKGVYSNENLASSKDTGTRSAAAAEYGGGGGGMGGLASMGGAGGMPDLGAMGLGGLGSAISFLSGIGGNMIGAMTGIASGNIFSAINSQISSLTSPEPSQDSPEKTPKKEAGQNPAETFSSYKPASLVQNQNARTEQLAETSTRASMPVIPQADITQQTYAADPTGGDPKVSLGNPGQQMALNGAQDNMVLADWYTNLFGKGGGNIVPDRDFYKNLA